MGGTGIKLIFLNVVRDNLVGKFISPDIKWNAEKLHQNGLWSCCDLNSAMQ